MSTSGEVNGDDLAGDYDPTSSLKTMAQSHFQGPLEVNGSGKSLTVEELEEVKKELEQIKKEYRWKEPERSFMDSADIKWRFGGKPDYSLTNLLFLKERSQIHSDDSLELIVENLVKTWEMERSHKLDCNQHQSVDSDNHRFSANGGKVFNNQEANTAGNYNVLLQSCPAWDSENTTWSASHNAFHDAFAAFPWEVLEVFSGPPKVAFSWRHWGHFTGTFEDHRGQGELVEVFGFGTAVVNEKLQIRDLEIYYDADQFLKVMRGDMSATTKKEGSGYNINWKSNMGCVLATTKNAKGISS